MILVGERLATVAGRATPRRPASPSAPARGSAGCRGGPVSAARWKPARCPTCCPAAGRVADAAARAEVAAAWNVDELPADAGPRHRGHPRRGRRRLAGRPARRRRRARRPARPGRGARGHRRRAVRGQPGAAPQRGHRARRRRVPGRPGRREGGHVRQLGGPRTGRSRAALPRHRPRLRRCGCSPRSPRRSGVDLGLPDAAAARAELDRLGAWDGARRGAPDASPRDRAATRPRAGACWRAGGCCWTPAACRTASRTWPAPHGRRSLRLSRATAAEIGASDGDPVTVSTDRGAITLPLEVTDMPDRRRVAAAELARFAGVRHARRHRRRRRRRSRSGGDRRDVSRPRLVRPRPVVAGDREGVVHLRVPAADRAGRDPRRAQGARPDADALRPQPGRARSGCCRAWPTASSWRSRKASSPPASTSRSTCWRRSSR